MDGLKATVTGAQRNQGGGSASGGAAIQQGARQPHLGMGLGGLALRRLPRSDLALQQFIVG